MITNLKKYINNYILRSRSSKAILLLGLICIILTIYKYKNILLVLSQIVVFIYVASTINCSIYGGCMVTPIFYLILVMLLTLFLIFDFLGIFDAYKNMVQQIYLAFETNNDTHMKHLLFPDDSEINPSFKTRKIPKLLNKDFKYNKNQYHYNSKDQNQYKEWKDKIVHESHIYTNHIFNSMSNKKKFLINKFLIN